MDVVAETRQEHQRTHLGGGGVGVLLIVQQSRQRGQLGVFVLRHLGIQALYSVGTIGIVREGLNEGFKFSNPREKDRCGCGESFRV